MNLFVVDRPKSRALVALPSDRPCENQQIRKYSWQL